MVFQNLRQVSLLHLFIIEDLEDENIVYRYLLFSKVFRDTTVRDPSGVYETD